MHQNKIQSAVSALRAGGVIAYPTEYCFGLGCDPRDTAAIQRLLAIKGRQKEQGVILIAADLDQIPEYAKLDNVTFIEQVKASWPGPVTWLLPAHESVSNWVRGDHGSIAFRIPAHSISHQLCARFEHPIVSTSANRHGKSALLSADAVAADMGVELDYILDAPVGGAPTASIIRDAITGQRLR